MSLFFLKYIIDEINTIRKNIFAIVNAAQMFTENVFM